MINLRKTQEKIMNNIIEFNNESNILTRNPTQGVELELVNRFIDF